LWVEMRFLCLVLVGSMSENGLLWKVVIDVINCLR
jgi:hypothetical protein